MPSEGGTGSNAIVLNTGFSVLGESVGQVDMLGVPSGVMVVRWFVPMGIGDGAGILFAGSGFGSVRHVGITMFCLGFGAVAVKGGVTNEVLDVVDEIVIMRNPNASSSE